MTATSATAFALLFGLLIAMPAPALAARAGTSVAVTIVAAPGTISLSTGIRFSTIGLAGATAGAPGSSAGSSASQGSFREGTGQFTLPQGSLATGARSMPGSIVVSGEGGQAFSISLPETVILNIDGTRVELRGFRHSGGETPRVGSDGTVRINFTADVNRDQLAILQEIATAAGEDSTIYLEIPAELITGQDDPDAGTATDGVQTIAVRKPDAFGAPAEFAESLFVLVSYN